MYQGVIPFFASQQFDGDVGNHFIGIHIERGTGTALDGVQDELIQVLACQHFVTGSYNGVRLGRLQCASPTIGCRTGFFDQGQAFDHRRMGGLTGNMKIFVGTQGLHTIISVRGDVFLTDRITFQTFELLLTHCHNPP